MNRYVELLIIYKALIAFNLAHNHVHMIAKAILVFVDLFRSTFCNFLFYTTCILVEPQMTANGQANDLYELCLSVVRGNVGVTDGLNTIRTKYLVRLMLICTNSPSKCSGKR